MKKVYFDIGTNLFQGYHQVYSMLGMNQDWHTVFVEPNPNFIIQENMDKITSIPNSRFVAKALCDDPEKQGERVSFYVSREKDIIDRMMDQGASIFKNKDNANATEILVNPISIIDLVSEYLDGYEWYFKFDCEGAEFDSIPALVSAYPDKIKLIICEFHNLGSLPERQWDAKKMQIISMLAAKNIPFMEWH